MSNIKNGAGAAVDKRISFLSNNRELNAAISRYFKYVHQLPITTSLFPPTTNHSTLPPLHPSPLTTHPSTPPPLTTNHSTPPPLTTPPLHHSTNKILVVQNEVEISSSICGIYPFWFAFGMKKNIRVYGFTYETTDWQNNLVDWKDFLDLQWLNRFQDSIEPDRVPYFDSARSFLYGVLKPHGGDSLYDLTADFHMTFANAVQYIGRLKQSTDQTKTLHDFKTYVIDRGIDRFSEFQQKEPRYHSFLSILPEADQLFAAVSELGKLIEEIEGMDMQGSGCLENLSRILPLIQVQTSFIHSFFFTLETYLQGGTN